MKKLSDVALEQELVACVGRERAAVACVLRYLREVEARELFLARGYSSLFAYCTGRLGYSEPEAHLRIQAMRLMRVVPEVESKLETGELSLSVAGEIAGAARREKLGATETAQLVGELAGSSKREAEKQLAARFPEAPKPERARPINEELVEIRFTVTREEAALLEEALNQRAHTNYERSYKKLLLDLAKKALQKPNALPRGPGQVEEAPAPAKAKRKSLSPDQGRSRYIPAPVRRGVWQRDKGRCQYRDPLTRHQCTSRHGLQIDHIKPYSQGGGHESANLRLLCGAHNRWRSKIGT